LIVTIYGQICRQQLTSKSEPLGKLITILEVLKSVPRSTVIK